MPFPSIPGLGAIIAAAVSLPTLPTVIVPAVVTPAVVAPTVITPAVVAPTVITPTVITPTVITPTTSSTTCSVPVATTFPSSCTDGAYFLIDGRYFQQHCNVDLVSNTIPAESYPGLFIPDLCFVTFLSGTYDGMTWSQDGSVCKLFYDVPTIGESSASVDSWVLVTKPSCTVSTTTASSTSSSTSTCTDVSSTTTASATSSSTSITTASSTVQPTCSVAVATIFPSSCTDGEYFTIDGRYYQQHCNVALVSDTSAPTVYSGVPVPGICFNLFLGGSYNGISWSEDASVCELYYGAPTIGDSSTYIDSIVVVAEPSCTVSTTTASATSSSASITTASSTVQPTCSPTVATSMPATCIDGAYFTDNGNIYQQHCNTAIATSTTILSTVSSLEGCLEDCTEYINIFGTCTAFSYSQNTCSMYFDTVALGAASSNVDSVVLVTEPSCTVSSTTPGPTSTCSIAVATSVPSSCTDGAYFTIDGNVYQQNCGKYLSSVGGPSLNNMDSSYDSCITTCLSDDQCTGVSAGQGGGVCFTFSGAPSVAGTSEFLDSALLVADPCAVSITTTSTSTDLTPTSTPAPTSTCSVAVATEVPSACTDEAYFTIDGNVYQQHCRTTLNSDSGISLSDQLYSYDSCITACLSNEACTGVLSTEGGGTCFILGGTTSIAGPSDSIDSVLLVTDPCAVSITTTSTSTDVTPTSTPAPTSTCSTSIPSDCTDGAYFTAEGRVYQQHCGSDLDGLPYSTEADSLSSCISYCASNADCTAAAYEDAVGMCYYLTDETTVGPASAGIDSILLVADPPCAVVTTTSTSTDVTPTSTPAPTSTCSTSIPSDCTDGAYFTVEGRVYQEHCGLYLDGLPYSTEADSLESCISYCASNADCTGAVYEDAVSMCYYFTSETTVGTASEDVDSILLVADPPCAIVTTTSTSTDVTPTSTPAPTSTCSVAVATSVPSGCTDGAYFTVEGNVYQEYCTTTLVGNPVYQFEWESLQECMNFCLSKETKYGGSCAGVTFAQTICSLYYETTTTLGEASLAVASILLVADPCAVISNSSSSSSTSTSTVSGTISNTANSTSTTLGASSFVSGLPSPSANFTLTSTLPTITTTTGSNITTSSTSSSTVSGTISNSANSTFTIPLNTAPGSVSSLTSTSGASSFISGLPSPSSNFTFTSSFPTNTGSSTISSSLSLSGSSSPSGSTSSGSIPSGLSVFSASGSTASGSSQSTPGPQITTKTQEFTTSTVQTTLTYTITSCASTITNCPVGSVTTETRFLYTTVCPVTATETKSHGAASQITSIPSGYTASTVYTTQIETISKCPPEVKNCPYNSVVTKTVPLYTTVCPVTELHPTSTAGSGTQDLTGTESLTAGGVSTNGGSSNGQGSADASHSTGSTVEISGSKSSTAAGNEDSSTSGSVSNGQESSEVNYSAGSTVETSGSKSSTAAGSGESSTSGSVSNGQGSSEVSYSTGSEASTTAVAIGTVPTLSSSSTGFESMVAGSSIASGTGYKGVDATSSSATQSATATTYYPNTAAGMTSMKWTGISLILALAMVFII